MPDAKKTAGLYRYLTPEPSRYSVMFLNAQGTVGLGTMKELPACHQVVLRYFVCEPLATIVIFPVSDFFEITTVVKASVLPTLSAQPSISSQSPVVAVDR
jgi:hypothetical protein